MREPTIGELMHRELIVVVPGTPVRRVARLFTEQGIGSVPVVDPHRRLLGAVFAEGLRWWEQRTVARHWRRSASAYTVTERDAMDR